MGCTSFGATTCKQAARLLQAALPSPAAALPCGLHSPTQVAPRPSLCCSALVGEVDDEKDAALDLSQIRAAPLKPVRH